jgi:hypothetical protein
MRFVHYPNPLRTRVILDETEKEVFRLKYKIEYLEDIICGIKYRLKEDPNKILSCPNPAMNGKTYYQLAKDEIPSNFYEKEFTENIYETADYYISELENGYHCGDCTCIPCNCLKCYAEYILGIETIKGLGKHEASNIDSLFTRMNGRYFPFDIRTIDEVLNELKNHKVAEIKPEDWNITQKQYEYHIPRWEREYKNSYNWLLKYKEEHNF